MNKLVYPFAKFFFQQNRDEGFTYLDFMDNYMPDVSKLLGSTYKLYAMNAFFGKGSIFDEDGLKTLK